MPSTTRSQTEMIIRTVKRDTYTAIANAALRDTRLSWKARGILAYLLSMSDGWKIYLTELANRATDGIDSLRSGVRELEAAGYIVKQQTRDEQGKLTGWEYDVYEQPTDGKSNDETIWGKTIYGKSNTKKEQLKELTRTEIDSNINLQDKTKLKENLKDCPDEKKPSGHSEMVAALEAVTGMDMKIKSNAGRIVRVAKELREAGYSFQNVIDFGDRWRRGWRYRQSRNPPSLSVIKAEIGAGREAGRAGDEDVDVFRKLYKKSRGE